MQAGECARCHALVAEQDLKAGRGAWLGSMVLCEQCTVPAEEALEKPAPKTNDFEVRVHATTGIELLTHTPNLPITRTAAPGKRDSAALPVAIPFAEVAVPIEQSTFFKEMDAESLGSTTPLTQTAGTEIALSSKAPSKRSKSAAGKLTLLGTGICLGAFALVLFFYWLTVIH